MQNSESYTLYNGGTLVAIPTYILQKVLNEAVVGNKREPKLDCDRSPRNSVKLGNGTEWTIDVEVATPLHLLLLDEQHYFTWNTTSLLWMLYSDTTTIIRTEISAKLLSCRWLLNCESKWSASSVQGGLPTACRDALFDSWIECAFVSPISQWLSITSTLLKPVVFPVLSGNEFTITQPAVWFLVRATTNTKLR